MQNELAADLGIQDLPVQEQDQLLSRFGEVALKAAVLAVIEKLPEGKKEELAKLAEAGDPVALKSFLDVEVPGHEEIARKGVEEAVREFRAFRDS